MEKFFSRGCVGKLIEMKMLKVQPKHSALWFRARRGERQKKFLLHASEYLHKIYIDGTHRRRSAYFSSLLCSALVRMSSSAVLLLFVDALLVPIIVVNRSSRGHERTNEDSFRRAPSRVC
jgi:hypothetical protein